MNREVQQRFEKAAECIDDAEFLLESKRYASVVNRAYYAMFHAATAALLTKDVIRSSHSGVIRFRPVLRGNGHRSCSSSSASPRGVRFETGK